MFSTELVPNNPCQPNPCGPNSQCRIHNQQAICSCLPEYRGAPPSCRPECIESSECPQNEACSNKKCGNPCIGACGVAAICQVINHNPICSCPPSFTGDPFTRCTSLRMLSIKISILYIILTIGIQINYVFILAPVQPDQINPCQPSPCGPNSVCREVNNIPLCECLPEYIGAPPQCRPQCISNSECAPHLACINRKCQNPCLSACGTNAECRVVSHTAMCICPEGYTGDAAFQCVTSILKPVYDVSPCTPSPCGSNAQCREYAGAGACICNPGYFGNPYENCRPECVVNTDCPLNKACVRNKCSDPCPGSCGLVADCQVVNHAPSCTCRVGYTGDPFRNCYLEREYVVNIIDNTIRCLNKYNVEIITSYKIT